MRYLVFSDNGLHINRGYTVWLVFSLQWVVHFSVFTQGFSLQAFFEDAEMLAHTCNIRLTGVDGGKVRSRLSHHLSYVNRYCTCGLIFLEI